MRLPRDQQVRGNNSAVALLPFCSRPSVDSPAARSILQQPIIVCCREWIAFPCSILCGDDGHVTAIKLRQLSDIACNWLAGKHTDKLRFDGGAPSRGNRRKR